MPGRRYSGGPSRRDRSSTPPSRARPGCHQPHPGDRGAQRRDLRAPDDTVDRCRSDPGDRVRFASADPGIDGRRTRRDRATDQSDLDADPAVIGPTVADALRLCRTGRDRYADGDSDGSADTGPADTGPADTCGDAGAHADSQHRHRQSTDPASDSGPDADADPGSDAAPDPDPAPDAGSDVDADTPADTGAHAASDADTGALAASDADPASDADCGSARWQRL